MIFEEKINFLKKSALLLFSVNRENFLKLIYNFDNKEKALIFSEILNIEKIEEIEIKTLLSEIEQEIFNEINDEKKIFSFTTEIFFLNIQDKFNAFIENFGTIDVISVFFNLNKSDLEKIIFILKKDFILKILQNLYSQQEFETIKKISKHFDLINNEDFLIFLRNKNINIFNLLQEKNFSFFDIKKFSNENMKTLLQNIDKEQLKFALQNTNEYFERLFIDNLSPRVGKIIKEEINEIVADDKKIKNARKYIEDKIEKLIEENKLQFYF